ncbi:Vam6/Vps39-like protein [Porphyridium purpureum]|uniref:Vam6/Vps39-like protein n=1 Tax=Porphyridium purpureum TaxID=35688 RepID=A0A5J4YYV2_PORPP|nr:Vam6/Vps39-like protein [Porphyridium purpureum]|eukprot:POR1654..scf208_2
MEQLHTMLHVSRVAVPLRAPASACVLTHEPPDDAADANRAPPGALAALVGCANGDLVRFVWPLPPLAPAPAPSPSDGQRGGLLGRRKSLTKSGKLAKTVSFDVSTRTSADEQVQAVAASAVWQAPGKEIGEGAASMTHPAAHSVLKIVRIRARAMHVLVVLQADMVLRVHCELCLKESTCRAASELNGSNDAVSTRASAWTNVRASASGLRVEISRQTDILAIEEVPGGAGDTEDGIFLAVQRSRATGVMSLCVYSIHCASACAEKGNLSKRPSTASCACICPPLVPDPRSEADRTIVECDGNGEVEAQIENHEQTKSQRQLAFVEVDLLPLSGYLVQDQRQQQPQQGQSIQLPTYLPDDVRLSFSPAMRSICLRLPSQYILLRMNRQTRLAVCVSLPIADMSRVAASVGSVGSHAPGGKNPKIPPSNAAGEAESKDKRVFDGLFKFAERILNQPDAQTTKDRTSDLGAGLIQLQFPQPICVEGEHWILANVAPDVAPKDDGEFPSPVAGGGNKNPSTRLGQGKNHSAHQHPHTAPSSTLSVYNVFGNATSYLNQVKAVNDALFNEAIIRKNETAAVIGPRRAKTIALAQHMGFIFFLDKRGVVEVYAKPALSEELLLAKVRIFPEPQPQLSSAVSSSATSAPQAESESDSSATQSVFDLGRNQNDWAEWAEWEGSMPCGPFVAPCFMWSSRGSFCAASRTQILTLVSRATPLSLIARALYLREDFTVMSNLLRTVSDFPESDQERGHDIGLSVPEQVSEMLEAAIVGRAKQLLQRFAIEAPATESHHALQNVHSSIVAFVQRNIPHMPASRALALYEMASKLPFPTSEPRLSMSSDSNVAVYGNWIGGLFLSQWGRQSGLANAESKADLVHKVLGITLRTPLCIAQSTLIIRTVASTIEPGTLVKTLDAAQKTLPASHRFQLEVEMYEARDDIGSAFRVLDVDADSGRTAWIRKKSRALQASQAPSSELASLRLDLIRRVTTNRLCTTEDVPLNELKLCIDALVLTRAGAMVDESTVNSFLLNCAVVRPELVVNSATMLRSGQILESGRLFIILSELETADRLLMYESFVLYVFIQLGVELRWAFSPLVGDARQLDAVHTRDIEESTVPCADDAFMASLVTSGSHISFVGPKLRHHHTVTEGASQSLSAMGSTEILSSGSANASSEHEIRSRLLTRFVTGLATHAPASWFRVLLIKYILVVYEGVYDLSTVSTCPAVQSVSWLIEVRALLLGLQGRHKEAVELLLAGAESGDQQERHNFVQVLRYCHSVPDSERLKAALALIKSSLALASKRGPFMLEKTWELIAKEQLLYTSLASVDESETDWFVHDALKSIPPGMNVRDANILVQHLLNSAEMRNQNTKLRHALFEKQAVIASAKLQKARAKSCVIDAKSVCAVCHQRIGHAVFLWGPSETLTHFACQKQLQ